MSDFEKLINASDLIKWIVTTYPDWYMGAIRDIYDHIAEMIQNAPTVKQDIEPERKKGHWVEIGDEPYDEWECDVCGFVIDGSGCIDPEEYRDVYKFCPRCGSDMRGEQDEID